MKQLLMTPIWLAALALLSACGSESEPEVAATPKPAAPAVAVAAKPAPAPEDPTAKMARAVGNGKPGAAVDIRYEFSSKPTIGAPMNLQVALIPKAGVDALEVSFSGMEGVSLSGTLTASFPNVEAGKAYTHTFSVLPERSGVFYITASVNTQIGGSTLGRTFSIPFVAGNPPAPEKPETLKDAASGEPIQPMKAEETAR